MSLLSLVVIVLVISPILAGIGEYKSGVLYDPSQSSTWCIFGTCYPADHAVDGDWTTYSEVTSNSTNIGPHWWEASITPTTVHQIELHVGTCRPGGDVKVELYKGETLMGNCRNGSDSIYTGWGERETLECDQVIADRVKISVPKASSASLECEYVLNLFQVKVIGEDYFDEADSVRDVVLYNASQSCTHCITEGRWAGICSPAELGIDGDWDTHSVTKIIDRTNACGNGPRWWQTSMDPTRVHRVELEGNACDSEAVVRVELYSGETLTGHCGTLTFYSGFRRVTLNCDQVMADRIKIVVPRECLFVVEVRVIGDKCIDTGEDDDDCAALTNYCHLALIKESCPKTCGSCVTSE